VSSNLPGLSTGASNNQMRRVFLVQRKHIHMQKDYTHRIHGAGIYANIGGILMGSMLPYIAAPWILWDMIYIGEW